MTAEPIPSPGRGFFGRRKGHKLRPRQQALFDTLLPTLALDLSKPAPADPRLLFNGCDAVRLEIGFGGAEHLIDQAERHPNIGFIGVEPFVNGMAKALMAIAEREIANVRVHHGEAGALLEWLPASSLEGIDLLYPDPWPKRRHWKRRIVQDAIVAAFARVMRQGAVLRFASDIPDYVAWTLARFLRSAEFEWTAQTADDWRRPWPGFAGTRYEAKAIREGRVPCYLAFRRR